MVGSRLSWKPWHFSSLLPLATLCFSSRSLSSPAFLLGRPLAIPALHILIPSPHAELAVLRPEQYL